MTKQYDHMTIYNCTHTISCTHHNALQNSTNQFWYTGSSRIDFLVKLKHWKLSTKQLIYTKTYSHYYCKCEHSFSQTHRISVYKLTHTYKELAVDQIIFLVPCTNIHTHTHTHCYKYTLSLFHIHNPS